MENRRYRRIDFNAHAFIEHENKVTIGEIENISNMGAFIKTSGNFMPNDKVVASIYFLEGGASLSVSMPGTIVRTTDKGVGFHSSHLDIYSLLHMEHLLVFNSGDPQKLTDDFYSYHAGKVEMNS